MRSPLPQLYAFKSPADSVWCVPEEMLKGEGMDGSQVSQRKAAALAPPPCVAQNVEDSD